MTFESVLPFSLREAQAIKNTLNQLRVPQPSTTWKNILSEARVYEVTLKLENVPRRTSRITVGQKLKRIAKSKAPQLRSDLELLPLLALGAARLGFVNYPSNMPLESDKYLTLLKHLTPPQIRVSAATAYTTHLIPSLGRGKPLLTLNSGGSPGATALHAYIFKLKKIFLKTNASKGVLVHRIAISHREQLPKEMVLFIAACLKAKCFGPIRSPERKVRSVLLQL